MLSFVGSDIDWEDYRFSRWCIMIDNKNLSFHTCSWMEIHCEWSPSRIRVLYNSSKLLVLYRLNHKRVGCSSTRTPTACSTAHWPPRRGRSRFALEMQRDSPIRSNRHWIAFEAHSSQLPSVLKLSKILKFRVGFRVQDFPRCRNLAKTSTGMQR